RRHTRFSRDWSSDVCSSDLEGGGSDDELERRLRASWHLEELLRPYGYEPIDKARDLALASGRIELAKEENGDSWWNVRGSQLYRSEERRVGREGDDRTGSES